MDPASWRGLGLLLAQAEVEAARDDLDNYGRGGGVLGQFLGGGEGEADHAQSVVAVRDAAEGAVGPAGCA